MRNLLSYRNRITPAAFLCLASTLALAQQPVAIYPTETEQAKACVIVNGRPTPGMRVTFQVDVIGNSGYHAHGATNRPGLSLSLTGGLTGADGCLYTNVTAPWYAGLHNLYAYSVTGEKSIEFQVSDGTFGQVSVVPGMSLTSDSQHQNVMFGATVIEGQVINRIAQNFYYTNPVGSSFILKRASLPWGGVLDTSDIIAPFSTPGPTTDIHRIGVAWDIYAPTVMPLPIKWQNLLDNIQRTQGQLGTCKVLMGSSLTSTVPPGVWHVVC